MADNDARIDLGIRGLGPAEHIGRGGFADVYRAEQLSLRRTVAVKVLRAQASDPEAEARFQRECHAIGAVSDHPHIVGVHEGGFTSNGRAYLVMEYLPGGPLSDRIEETGPIPGDEAVDICIKIGRALAEAHRVGILHRDLKPANIMISAYGEPALGDFGIARIEGGHRTATGLVTASFAHAAPEVLEGQEPSAAADIYSLGSTLYELLTGRGPYYDQSDESVWPLMKRILSEPMPSPESAGMSTLLGYTFRRATARNPADRYDTAEEFVSDLESAASAPPVTVDPIYKPSAAQTTRYRLNDEPDGEDLVGAAMLDAPRSGPMTLDQPPAAATPDLFLPAPDPAMPTGDIEPWADLYSPPDDAAPPQQPVKITLPSTKTETTKPRSWMLGVVVAVLGGLGLLAIAGMWVSSSLGGGTTSNAVAIVDGAEAGPLNAGEPLELSVRDAPIGALFRPVIDGLVTGTGVTDLAPLTLAPGRHSVAVEVVSGDRSEMTEPVDVYVLDDLLSPGYRANLASVSVDGAGWAAALATFDQLVADGHPDLRILRSDDVVGQTPGYWNLFVPGFGEDPAAAEAYCETHGLVIPTECFAGYFDPST